MSAVAAHWFVCAPCRRRLPRCPRVRRFRRRYALGGYRNAKVLKAGVYVVTKYGTTVFPRIVMRALLFFSWKNVITIRDCSTNRGCTTIRSRLKLYAKFFLFNTC